MGQAREQGQVRERDQRRHQATTRWPGPSWPAVATAEVKRCAEILGIETEVLDIHDGELMPTLENRRTITRKIREWQADVVISPRPNDYHPDHRYTAILVQDAAFMVIVPSFCPDVPALRKNPVFLYSADSFQKPNPFKPDVVVPIDPVLDQKVACIDALESQFYEWNPWLSGYLDEVPQDKQARLAWTRKRAEQRYGDLAQRFRAELIAELGEVEGKAVKYAEAFEICEYGTQPSREELLAIFPFFKQTIDASDAARTTTSRRAAPLQYAGSCPAPVDPPPRRGCVAPGRLTS